MKITSEKVNDLVNGIIRMFDPKAVVLFGSFVNGTADIGSDLDIMVVMESNLSKIRRSAEVRAAIGFVGFPVDVLVYTPEEVDCGKKSRFSFISEILTTGEVVYGNA